MSEILTGMNEMKWIEMRAEYRNAFNVSNAWYTGMQAMSGSESN